jgi:hypothetical protein
MAIRVVARARDRVVPRRSTSLFREGAKHDRSGRRMVEMSRRIRARRHDVTFAARQRPVRGRCGQVNRVRSDARIVRVARAVEIVRRGCTGQRASRAIWIAVTRRALGRRRTRLEICATLEAARRAERCGKNDRERAPVTHGSTGTCLRSCSGCFGIRVGADCRRPRRPGDTGCNLSPDLDRGNSRRGRCRAAQPCRESCVNPCRSLPSRWDAGSVRRSRCRSRRVRGGTHRTSRARDSSDTLPG